MQSPLMLQAKIYNDLYGFISWSWFDFMLYVIVSALCLLYIYDVLFETSVEFF